MYQNILVQMNKQMIEQMKVRESCYEILGNLLSDLESYAFRISGKLEKEKLFCKYNNNKQKSVNDIKDHIIAQIELFKFSYQMYIKNYGNYDFPENLSKQQVINFLQKWKSIIHEQKQHIFYDAVIEIINGNFNISLNNLFL